jgi:glycosyl transferase, family 25
LVGERNVHVHFINLDRSKDRLAEFQAVNSHLTEVTRIPAVEERRIDLDLLTREGLVNGDILSMYPIGSLCHVLSELALWNKAIETKQPVTIADDDTIFNLKFEATAPEVIRSLPPDWDLILWGWNFDLFMIFDMLPGVTPCVCQFDQDKMRLNTRAFQEMSISPRAHKLTWAFGMISYTVSPKGAQNLKSKCFPLQPMLIPCPDGIRTPPHSPSYRNVGPDNTINNFHRHLQSFVCVPPLVISKNDHAMSTIQAGGAGTVSFRGSEERAAEVNADDIFVLSSQALELYRQQRLEEALAVFDKLLALSPNAVEAHYNRATILGSLDRFDEALTSYDKVLALKPDFVFALNNRGWLLQKLRRYDDALASYDKALAIAPDYTAAKGNRDLLLRAQKQAAGAAADAPT